MSNVSIWVIFQIWSHIRNPHAEYDKAVIYAVNFSMKQSITRTCMDYVDYVNCITY